MTKEEKQLLFKYLSAILPYHIRVKVWLKDGTTEEGMLDLEHNYGDVLRDAFYYNKIIDIKPYLRPMSSMTEEEKEEMKKVIKNDYISPFGELQSSGVDNLTLSCVRMSSNLINWLLENHFDFLGLIPKGLAIEVTEENNPYKE